MRLTVSILIYLIAIVLEIAVLPPLIGAAVPALSFGALVVGMVVQPFGSGLALAAIAGLARDLLAPPTYATHTIFVLLVFAASHLFRTFVEWDEPLRRLGAGASALMVVPIAWAVSVWLSGVLHAEAAPLLRWQDLMSKAAVREVIFAAMWFSAFSWFTIRRARRKRTAALSRL